MFLGPNFFKDPNLGADFGLKAQEPEQQEDFLTISHKTAENRNDRYQENSVTEERAFWNPRRFATKISPSSHLIASNADDTKELLPSNETDKNSELREKKEGRSGDPEIWSNSTMLKSNETIPFQDQIENQVSEDKNSQEIFNRTQHRRSYNSGGIFYPELSKEDNSQYYDFQHARKALSYTLTTPRLPTVKYSYKKKPQKFKVYDQKSNQKTKASLVYRPGEAISSSNSFLNNTHTSGTSGTSGTSISASASESFPPLSYAQPSHKCKTKVWHIFV